MPTYTYSGDPSTSPMDAVRFWLSDVGPTKWYKANEEINFVLGLDPNPFVAAAYIARSIAASLASNVNRRIGDLSINAGDAVKAWIALANDMDAKALLGVTAMPYAGGISHSDVEQVASNCDRVKPPFREKQFDHRANDTGAAEPGLPFIAGDWG